MMPSRGVHAFRGLASQIAKSQSRNFSIARPTSSRASPIFTSSRPRISRQVASAFITSHAIRNASSNATSTLSSSTSSLPSVDTLSLDDIDFSTAAISAHEKIGYLKEIGLDYGWGPTAMLEWTVEHLHISAGLPWWAAIATTAVLTRVGMFWFFARAADSAARAAAIAPLTAPLMKEMTAARASNNQTAAAVAMSQLTAIRKDAGVSLLRQLAPAVMQGVIGFCGFKLLRAMAALPVPGLFDGGALWFTDLTIPDGYLLLPAVMAVSMHLMLRFGGETGNADTMDPRMRVVMVWIMPVVIFAITGTQSAALCVWFATTGLCSFIQAVLIRNPTIRRQLGIAPVYKTAEKPPSALDYMGFSSPGAESQAAPVKPRIRYQAPAAYTRPTYQAPMTRTAAAQSPIIDTTLAKESQSQTRKGAQR